jgi:hypothetical protein
MKLNVGDIIVYKLNEDYPYKNENIGIWKVNTVLKVTGKPKMRTYGFRYSKDDPNCFSDWIHESSIINKSYTVKILERAKK